MARSRNQKSRHLPENSAERPGAAAKPIYFRTAEAFRGWLVKQHATAREVVVGFYKKDSGRCGLTYPEALDEALCFGWIDGVKRSDGPEGYTQRFSPRRAKSTWSLINVRHVERLTAAGRMQAAGLAAFAARSARKTGIYSFENRPRDLPPDLAKIFQVQATAWAFWERQPPGYRRTATWYVVSAKQQATRERRLARLIADSAAQKRLGI
jgi:uncharacterized protein YdeI (YjbR/CyaY-like superfamily)